MKYYAIAKKINQVYGHGDNGEELHICQKNQYHPSDREFHPIFKTMEKANAYMSTLQFNYDLIVVELLVSS